MTSAWVWPSKREQAPPAADEAGTFLMDAFRTFYVETVQQVELATRAEGAADPDGAAPEDAVRSALVAALERLDDDLGGTLTEQERSLFQEAQYVMVALADDLLIAASWPGQRAWMKAPLEARVFGTYEAGEVFFARLDEYLRRERKRPASTDILYVYLMALCLGFRGRYAETASSGKPAPDAPDPIAKYSADLRQHIQRLSPGAARPPTEMCPAAASYTVTDRTPQSLASLRQPLVVALALAVVSLVLSAIVWPREVAHVVQSLDRIEALR